jgi:hypothetical protein
MPATSEEVEPEVLVPVRVFAAPEPSPGQAASYRECLLVGFSRIHQRRHSWTDDPEVARRAY